MHHQRIEVVGLRLAGSLILLIGLGHVLMPGWGYAASASAGMTEAAKNHFYFLGTFAICSFLLAFATLALTASFAPGARSTRVFSSVMALVWVARVVLELRYPVDLPIFFLRYPHPVLLPILCTIALAFTAAAWAGTKARADSGPGIKSEPVVRV